MNIYVSNLNFSTSTESLQNLFSEYGEVASARIITDRETGRSRGFGFVEMANDAEGEDAIAKLNDTDFEGKTIGVAVARPREDRGGFNRPRSNGGYRRDYNGGRDNRW